jgi:signal peptidase II
MARFWSLSLLIAFLIIIDQLTKGAVQSSLALGETVPVIEGFFSIAHVHNQGAAFGIGSDGHPVLRQILFLLLPVLFCFWIFWALIKSLKGTFHMSLAYALILAGANGNLLDRFSLGYVVDFFMFYWGDEKNHFPAFNIADSCISIAALILITDYFIQRIAAPSNAKGDDVPNHL